MDGEPNVKQAVPFFGVTDMQAALGFYVDGLGFQMKHKWIDEAERLRWCWLELGGAAIMLQTFLQEDGAQRIPAGKLGLGVVISFQCRDALEMYLQARRHGLQPSRPFVGNRMWVTALQDPDGYRLEFESPTDAPEEAEYHEAE